MDFILSVKKVSVIYMGKKVIIYGKNGHVCGKKMSYVGKSGFKKVTYLLIY